MTKDYVLGEEVRTWSVYVPEEAGSAVSDVLNSGWINTGKKEAEFRRMASDRFDLSYCVATVSGTLALKASYATAGVGPGDEVVTTPYTFIATNTAILELGAKPVFVDIDYDTLNISPESVREAITERTKAIVCVHFGGVPCDLDELRAISADFDVPLIEDSAHAMGSMYKGKPIGAEGDFVTFSFQCVKVVTCGDGGLIATNTPERYAELKRRVWYGVDREQKSRTPLDPLPDDITELGYKANMNDITAALGIVGLRHLDAALERRREIGEIYRAELKGYEKLTPQRVPEDRQTNYQIFPVHVDDRKAFADHMAERGIHVTINNRRNDRYSIMGGLRDLPNTDRADRDTILIPLHLDLTDTDVDRIVESMRAYENR